MNHRNIVQKLLAWFARNARPLPWRRTRDPYAIWVSEIMLQQTQVKTVLPYWERWMRALPNLAALAKAKPHTLHKLWEGLGYYTRVRNLQRAARLIVEQHGGQVPKDFEALLALPGIGRYTAGAICSIAFDQPQPILDGNVIRVLTRLCGIAGDPRGRKTNARLWQLAKELVLLAAETDARRSASPHASRITQHAPAPAPSSTSRSWNSARSSARHENPSVASARSRNTAWLIAKAAYINCPDSAGASAPRPAVSSRSLRRERGLFLVRQRPAGVVNAHLWEFPNLELAPDDSDLEAGGPPRAGSAAARRLNCWPRSNIPSLATASR